MNALRLAFGLLTAVPVGVLPQVDRRSSGAAILLAPLTTLPLVGLVLAAHGAVRAGAPALLAAALVVACGALYTRAMHLDGLADTADGLSAGYDAATSLRAMKASDTGPSGVAAVTLALLLQTAALAALLASPGGAVLAGLAWLVSRHCLALACRRGMPAAQPTGLGALVAGSIGAGALAVSLAALAVVSATAGLCAAGAGPTGAWVADPTEGAPGWWCGPLVALGGLAATEALLRRCRRRLGGVTGDVLGATVEVSLTAGLVLAALTADLA